MYKKILLWLVSKEMKKDDFRKKESFLGDIFSRAYKIASEAFTEDNPYEIFYLVFHNLINSFRFDGLHFFNGRVTDKKIKLLDLDESPILGGIRSEIIAYYEYGDKPYFFDLDAYRIAEAKYLLRGKK